MNARLIYASTREKDLLYALRIPLADPALFLDTGAESYVFLDHREYGLFKERNKNPRLHPVLLDTLMDELKARPEEAQPLFRFVLFLLDQYGMPKKLEVPELFPLPLADFLREKGYALIPRHPLYGERAKKAAWEAEAIRKAVAGTEKAFALIRSMLQESRIEGNAILLQGSVLTSEMLKLEVDRLFLQEGLANEEGIIISSGLHSAIPHHPGEGPIVPHAPIVCDIFPRSKETGYVADLTRTFAKGDPPEEFKTMYEAVFTAQEEGIRKIKPGVAASKIHEAVAAVILKRGFQVGHEGFVHATGHGIGLEVHEQPVLAQRSQAVLEPGNAVTVEPGLYYPDKGGIRIEDNVLVTEEGFEVLSRFPRDSWIIP